MKNQAMSGDRNREGPSKFDVIVVGAGFAGMYMLHRLRKSGFKVRVFERGDGVGGTWYWNRYPGARCDVESMEYSYTFSEELQQEWEWSERYSGQPEILRYAEHFADRFDLRRDIQFETSVTSALFDESNNSWAIETDDGEEFLAHYLVLATGCLSSANLPSIEGISEFKGESYHTGRWPHERVEFSGKRVGVIGSGSSAIQAIPHVAEASKSLTVFQRTANFSVPARNGPLDKEYEQKVKSNYQTFREVNKRMPAALGANHQGNNQSALEATPEDHDREFSKRWKVGGFGFMGSFNDLGLNRDANEFAAEFVRKQIRDLVKDPVTASRLSPTNVIGCKRLCLDTNYYETYNLPHVSLVDINENPIEQITARGVQCHDSFHELDCIVFATGFDAMTGTLLRIDIRGLNGLRLREKWEAGPRTFLGLTTSDFPNMFTISGPGSPSVLTNMIVSIEQHVEWIDQCLCHMRDTGVSRINAQLDAENEWVDYVNAIADLTLYPTCNSWYLGANIPGKPRVFMPHVGFPNYVEKCNEVVANDYKGFELV